jgi:hypothetical protein
MADNKTSSENDDDADDEMQLLDTQRKGLPRNELPLPRKPSPPTPNLRLASPKLKTQELEIVEPDPPVAPPIPTNNDIPSM